MLKNDKEHPVVGLVERSEFDWPKTAGAHNAPRDEFEKVLHFEKNARFLGRYSALTWKAEDDLAALFRAWMVLETKFNAERMTDNTEVTLVDGTVWEDVVEHTTPVSVIAAINVFRRGDTYHVIVSVEERKVFKGQMHYQVGNEDTRRIYYFNYDEKLDMNSVAVMLADVVETGSRPTFFNPWRFLDEAVARCRDPRQEYIVGAAQMVGNAVWSVPRPARHHHVICSKEYQEYLEYVKLTTDELQSKTQVPGFITNHGNFVPRRRAMFLAVIGGQFYGKDLYVIANTEWTAGMKASVPNPVENGCTYYLQSIPFIPDATEMKMTGLKTFNDVKFGAVTQCTTHLFSEDLW